MSSTFNNRLQLQLPRRQSKPLSISQQKEADSGLESGKILPQQRQRSMLPEKGLASLILLTTASENCTFCSQNRSKHPFSIRMRIALYDKYSASQNYYYTKDVNELIGNQRTTVAIKVKDMATLDEEEEFLNRFYAFHECDGKMKRLTEYYKFHHDISRMFMLPIANILNKYHDKKRRIYYAQITRMLKEKEGQKDPPQQPQNQQQQGNAQQGKPPSKSDEKEEHFQSFLISERVLAPLDESDTKSMQSHTLLDLNYRLNDILQTTTRSTQSYFFENEASQTIGNLSNFLHHLQLQNSQVQPQKNDSSLPDKGFKSSKNTKGLERTVSQSQFNLGAPQQDQFNLNIEPANQKIPKDSLLFQKKQSFSGKNNFDLKKDNQNDEKASQIYQMNQEMIALGILKSKSPPFQTEEQPKTKEKLIKVGNLSHLNSHLVSPAISSNPSSCFSKEPQQLLIQKLPSSNEFIGTFKDGLDSPSKRIKEGTILHAGKESLKMQNAQKNDFNLNSGLQQNTQNHSLERVKSPKIKETTTKENIQDVFTNRIRDSKADLALNENLTSRLTQRNTASSSQQQQQYKEEKYVTPSQLDTQHLKTIHSDNLAQNLSPSLALKQIPKISQYISPQFALHLQQKQQSESKSIQQQNSSNLKTKNDPLQGQQNQNSEKPQQLKQINSFKTLQEKEKDDSPKSPSKIAVDNNNGKRLKTYEAISTRRDNQFDMKGTLYKQKGDKYLSDQLQVQINPLDSQNSLEKENPQQQNRASQIIVAQESNKGFPSNDLMGANSHSKSAKEIQKDKTKLSTDVSPLKTYKGNFDQSPQKHCGSLHISKAKPSFSSISTSQSIPSSLRMSQMISQPTRNANLSQNDVQMNNSKGFPPKKSSLNEIGQFQGTGSQPNIGENPSLYRVTEQQETVSSFKPSDSTTFKKSQSNTKFDNLGELKQFYKEVHRKTDMVTQYKEKDILKPSLSGNPSISSSQELQQAKLSSHRKNNYFAKGDASLFQKGSLTQRFTQNSQDQSNSKEISPRIQRLTNKDFKGNEQLSQISVALKQVLTERDSSLRRTSSQLKNSSGTLSSPNLQLFAPNLQTQGSVGSSQTLTNGSKDNGQKKLQFKQQGSKNSQDTPRTNASNQDSSQKTQSQGNQMGAINQMNGLLKNPISLIPQYVPSQQPLIGDNQQNSLKKGIDKVKHSRINSMNAASSVYSTISSLSGSNHLGKSLQSQQIKQMNSDYGKISTQPSQQLHTNQNSQQFGSQNHNNQNIKTIYHKYNKSEADLMHQNSLQTQPYTANLALNQANPPLGSFTKPILSKNTSNPQPSISEQSNLALQSSQQSLQRQDLKRGVNPQFHHTCSSQNSQSPIREDLTTGKKNQEQQQFFTYANNNIVNIYVNSQQGGNILQANNLINNQSQNINQNIGSLVNTQINANRNFNMQQNTSSAPLKKTASNLIQPSKFQQDNQKF